MQVWRDDGLPPAIPMFDTETNAHGGEASVEVFGALWLADSFAGFLTAGGKGTFYYHALPYSPPHPNCKNSWGTYRMFQTDEKYEIKTPTSQYFAAQMLTKEWVEPEDAEHKLFAAAGDIKDSSGHVLVTAYAVLRPDGQWSLLVINKDHDHDHAVRIVFEDSQAKTKSGFAGPVRMISFGKNQYEWHPARRNGYAEPDGPATTSDVPGGNEAVYKLPAASVNVLRGRIAVSGAKER
jgi:hypothetical protein